MTSDQHPAIVIGMDMPLEPGDLVYYRSRSGTVFIWAYIITAKKGERVELISLYLGQEVPAWAGTRSAPEKLFLNGEYTIIRRPR